MKLLFVCFSVFFFFLKAEALEIENQNVSDANPVSATEISSAENIPNVRSVAVPYSPSSYIEDTKTMEEFSPRSARKTPTKEMSQRPLEYAKADSALVLDRYENKHFLKRKIQKVAKEVVEKSVKTQSIEEQMGEIGKKRISVSIDENINVRDAIMEVSHLAGIDIEIDPEIDGSVILSLRNAKIANVLERIAEMANLNITVKNEIVRFMSDKPVTKNYSIAFVDGSNSGMGSSMMGGNMGNIAGNTSNMGSGRMGGGFNNFNGGFNGGWNGGGMGGFGGGFNNFNGGGMGMMGGAGSINSLPVSRGMGNMNNQNTMWEQFEEGLKYIVSQKKGVEYSINKQAGVVTLRATLGIHKEVEEYIERIKKLATTQILVEVRLVEVSLEDEFSSGIDFSYTKKGDSFAGTFIPAMAASASGSPFIARFNTDITKGLKSAVQFLQTFGTTKTISSPRLNVMNNQRAQLSFAKDYVYFHMQPQLQNQFVAPGVTPTNPTTPIIVQSQMQTVPIGVILNIQATADIEEQEITMSIHPVISSIVGEKEDPAASFLSGIQMQGVTGMAQVTNSVPIVEKKELDSTLRIKSGDIMVIGGFNEERTMVVRKGIPYLKDMPVVKFFFGSDQKLVKNVETVIFIKATIVGSENPISEEDVKFYNDFA